MAAAAPSIDPSEVEKFSRIAAEWWNPKGKFGLLHVFNPVRLAWIKEQACARLGRDPLEREPFAGLRLLDIGCGGGLLSEPMARLGARVTGVDPSENNIRSASVHADEMGLAIDYRAATAEDLAAAGVVGRIVAESLGRRARADQRVGRVALFYPVNGKVGRRLHGYV